MQLLAGIHPVTEALRAGQPIERILIAKGAGGPKMQLIIDLAKKAKVPLRYEPREALDRASKAATHQGVVAFTTGLRNWGDSVRLAIKSDARQGANEFRGAKITAWANNLSWYEEAHERGFDEVVLLDEHGRVSECTSANLFAVFGNEVVTPALDTGCLPGITREVLLDSIHVPGVTIREGHLLPADLERAGAVFMTSSTRDVLPVTEVEGLRIRSESDVPARLLAAFRAHIAGYVDSRRASIPRTE